jgi:hypothetical protein
MAGSTKVELSALESAIARDLARTRGVSVEAVVGQLIRDEAAIDWLRGGFARKTTGSAQDAISTKGASRK